MSIKRPDGSTLVSSTVTGNAFFDTQVLPVAGTYTILVDPWDTSTGSVTLTLYDVPADATSTATVGGSAVTMTTTVPGQNAQRPQQNCDTIQYKLECARRSCCRRQYGRQLWEWIGDAYSGRESAVVAGRSGKRAIHREYRCMESHGLLRRRADQLLRLCIRRPVRFNRSVNYPKSDRSVELSRVRPGRYSNNR